MLEHVDDKKKILLLCTRMNEKLDAFGYVFLGFVLPCMGITLRQAFKGILKHGL
jgi:hypothetical protein